MRKIGPHMAAAGLVLATSCLATAGERPFTRNVQDLKEGQCVNASYVYEQGELLKMGRAPLWFARRSMDEAFGSLSIRRLSKRWVNRPGFCGGRFV